MSNSPLFSTFLNSFFYVGLWSRNQSKIYKFYSFLILLSAIFFAVTFVFVTKNAESLPEFGFCFGASLTLIVNVLKILISRTSKFQSLLSEMFRNDEYINMKSHEDIRGNYLDYSKTPYKVVNFYRMAMVINLTINVFASMLVYFKFRSDETEEKPFPFPFWMPFDGQKYYFLSHVYLNIVAMVVGAIVVSGDFLVLAPIMYLNCRLSNLKFVLADPKIFFESDVSSSVNYYQIMRSCVLEHHAINRDLKNFNSITMYLNLFDFLFHSTEIAGFLVSILASEILLTPANIFNFACAMVVLFQLFIVYWHGQILIEESGSIASSIYKSEWYEADNKTRRLLIMMMMRSQKTLGVTIGPFFFVDMQLFLKIVKTVYTITTLFFRS